MARRRLQLGLTACALLGGVAIAKFASPRAASAPMPAAGEQVTVIEDEADAPRVEALPADATAARDDSDRATFFELPDGRRLRALNGVDDANGLAWPASVSKAPVIGIQRGRAYDAYIHEDGTQTATVHVRNLTTGATESASMVARPIELNGRTPVRVDLPMGPSQPLPIRRRM